MLAGFSDLHVLKKQRETPLRSTSHERQACGEPVVGGTPPEDHRCNTRCAERSVTESQCRDRDRRGACSGPSPGRGGPRRGGMRPRQKHPLGRPRLPRNWSVSAQVPSSALCGSWHEFYAGWKGPDWCPPRSMPPLGADTCAGRTPSASHSFQVSSIPGTVQAWCASWNNSAPHPQRQYARLCRHPTRAPRHVAHTQGPARVSPSPDVRASSHDRVHRPGRLGALLWRSAFSGCVCLCVCLFFLSCPVVCPCVE